MTSARFALAVCTLCAALPTHTLMYATADVFAGLHQGGQYDVARTCCCHADWSKFRADAATVRAALNRRVEEGLS